MTQEEILEYNKRCAEFLGGVYDSDMTRYWFYLPVKWDGVFAPTTGELRFHSDWNWIMEVIKFIESLRLEVPGYFVVDYYTINSGHNYCTISSGLKHADGETVSPHFYEKTSIGKDNKEAVIHAINQFLIWYEQNK